MRRSQSKSKKAQNPNSPKEGQDNFMGNLMIQHQVDLLIARLVGDVFVF
jgi:hypothetical protein